MRGGAAGLTSRAVKWSFHLARIAGIDVRVHATFFLLLAWFGYIYYAEGGFGAMVLGLAFILLLFVCVLLHEFGHALAARAYGIHTPDITLLPIGGVARLERMPDKPWQEFVVALAGPAVNVVIALGLFLVLGKIFDLRDLAVLHEQGGNLLTKLLAINVILVVFNLVPAFPMDGGRILRALLATRLKHAKATRIAAGVGQAIAIVFGLLGLFGNPMLLFIAVFVFFGAQQEAAYAAWKESTGETTVAQIMQTLPPLFRPGLGVLEAVQLAMRDTRPVYPLVDGSLRPIGLVPAAALAGALPGGLNRPVEALAEHVGEILVADASIESALRLANRCAQADFLVVNAAGQLVGLVSRQDLAAVLPG